MRREVFFVAALAAGSSAIAVDYAHAWGKQVTKRICGTMVQHRIPTNMEECRYNGQLANCPPMETEGFCQGKFGNGRK